MLLCFWFIICNSFLSSPEKSYTEAHTHTLSEERYIDFLVQRIVFYFFNGTVLYHCLDISIWVYLLQTDGLHIVSQSQGVSTKLI